MATAASPGPGNTKIVFSGIQPTGVPHLGNLLGALQQWKRLQDEAEASTKLLFCVVDLHALTSPKVPERPLSQLRREMLAAMLAVGLDPERSILFYQSDVGLFDAKTMLEHPELIQRSDG
jgi:tryptophanyl-tRNA synthetase